MNQCKWCGETDPHECITDAEGRRVIEHQMMRIMDCAAANGEDVCYLLAKSIRDQTGLARSD